VTPEGHLFRGTIGTRLARVEKVRLRARNWVDILIENLKNARTIAVMKRARMMRQYEGREARRLLDWVEAGLKGAQRKPARAERSSETEC